MQLLKLLIILKLGHNSSVTNFVTATSQKKAFNSTCLYVVSVL